METLKLFIYVIAVFLLISGCGVKPQPVSENRVYLTLDFEQSRPLRYKFVSSRQIEVLFEDKTMSESDKKTNYSESLETVIAYKPVKINPYGLNEIEATIESVNASSASGGSPKDAAQSLAGKTFKLIVGPTGRIEDRKQLEEIIKQAGKTAYRPVRESDRIKEPDMISDFMATQMFLWDSISSVKEPQKGVAVGDTWQSQLSIPSPMPELFNTARDVVYKLESLKDTNGGKIAVITGKYSPSKTLLQSWFVPYEGNFQLSGPFGVYVNCQIAALEGSGEELFNIDQGKSISYGQDYQMTVNPTMSLIPIRVKITVKQHLSMQLLN